MWKKTSFTFLFCVIVSQQWSLVKGLGEECSLDTECLKITRCPAIKDIFHTITYKPYCNLNKRGTFVCCPVKPAKYVTPKDETSRVVQACKSYQSIRTCEKSLIVGGKKADPKEYPFMALLFYKNGDVKRWDCGGTLISSRYVISAAHCFFLENNPNTVRLGELDYATDQDVASPVDFNIKNYILHPGYQHMAQNFHDIALVELHREAEFNEFIVPACLPLIDGRGFRQFYAAGWGAIRDASAGSSHLLKVKLDSFNDTYCLDRIGPRSAPLINTTIQMCAGSFLHERDTCTGDSGGPLFVDHPDYGCMFLVLGVTSYSEGGCANVNYPAFYTRVSSYIDWIEKIVWG